jgi:hypothetical protein
LKAYVTLIADTVSDEDPKMVWRKDMLSLINLAKYLLCDDCERFLEKESCRELFPKARRKSLLREPSKVL